MIQGMKLLSQNEKETGLFTGSTKACTLTGCRGLRYAVRWPDGRLTWPCMHGLERNGKGFKIL